MYDDVHNLYDDVVHDLNAGVSPRQVARKYSLTMRVVQDIAGRLKTNKKKQWISYILSRSLLVLVLGLVVRLLYVYVDGARDFINIILGWF